LLELQLEKHTTKRPGQLLGASKSFEQTRGDFSSISVSNSSKNEKQPTSNELAISSFCSMDIQFSYLPGLLKLTINNETPT